MKKRNKESYNYQEKQIIYLSACAKMDLWQSPKSKPQIFIFLSAEPVTIKSPSDEISIHRTGSLWPYNERKNLNVSAKWTWKMNEIIMKKNAWNSKIGLMHKHEWPQAHSAKSSIQTLELTPPCGCTQANIIKKIHFLIFIKVSFEYKIKA